ncbi:MAG: hypothetical protein CL946_01010 [Ectothiorhodospiraceae bacterium]|nr:hypothetical protein [Ectothiorhodospiraceae bacterium]
MDTSDIRAQIRAVITNPTDERGVSALVRTCISLSHAIVERNKAKYLHVASRAGYSLEDMAVLAIQNLFIPRFQKPCYEIVRFFADRIETETDAELTISLRRIIHKKTSQILPEIIGENSPDSRKLYRVIYEFMHANPDWNSAEIFNDTVYFTVSKEEAQLQKPAMPLESSVNALLSEIDGVSSTPELIRTAFTLLQNQEQYRKAWSMLDLISILREYYLHVNYLEQVPPAIEADQSVSSDIEDQLEASLESLRTDIFPRYLRKDKLTEADCARVEAAARAMLRDIVENQLGNLFEYYEDQHPHVSYDEYRRNGRIQFEYIMRLVKDDFRGRISQKVLS